jgi:DNA-binding CsgD family transcriptional regulator
MLTLRVCMPHLINVMRLAGRMQRERCERQSAFDALDVVQDGVIMIEPNGAASHVNAAAEAMLCRGDRLRRCGSGVVASSASDDIKLQQAIQSARWIQRASAGGVAPAGSTPSTRVVLGRSRPGWPLVVSALPAGRALQAGGDPRAVILHLADPGDPHCLSVATLRQEFGLTAREAALTEQLARGATLREAAEALEISVGTARQYLKAIFDSVGVHSQADLLRVIRR